MQHVIMAIHLMVVIALVALVLYQKSEGGALGMGQSGFFTGRGQANAVTRATSILGACFFVTSLLLTILPAYERRAASGEDWTTAVDQKLELKEIKPPSSAAPEAVNKPAEPEDKGTVFDQLKRAQEKRQALQRQQQSEQPQAPVAAPAEPQKPAATAPSPPESEKPVSPPAASDAREVRTPEIKAPEAKAPEIKWVAPQDAETKAPEAKAPEAKSPEVKAPETKWLAPQETRGPEAEPPASKPLEFKPPIDPPGEAPKN